MSRKKIIDRARAAAKEGRPFGIEKGMAPQIALKSLFDVMKGKAKRPEKIEFIEPVKLDRCWGPWKRRGGHGNDGGFVLTWAARGIGFGELTFCIKDGKTHCGNEAMGPKFIRAALESFLESVILDDK